MINRGSKTYIRSGLLAGISALAMLATDPALAQLSASSDATEEIIVTARKRPESLMRTPVVMQAIGEKQLERMKFTKLSDISAMTPGLEVNYAYTLSGAVVNMRGIQNGGSANFIDQSVGLNIDGASVTSGAFYRSAMFDIGQIEIMKGPQALFFGKSTSAGLIAIRSAEPTETWEAKATVGYEFRTDEIGFSTRVSGPLTDKLGIRIAGFFGRSKGFGTNPNPDVISSRTPQGEEYAGRIYLKYDDPDIGLRVKLKFDVSHFEFSNAWLGNQQNQVCPGRTVTPNATYAAAGDDCKLNLIFQGNPDPKPYSATADFSPGSAAFASFYPAPEYGNGAPYSLTNTATALLNVEYDIMEGLTLTSISAWAYVKAEESGISANLNGAVGLYARDVAIEYTQELRLTSNFEDSWVNFMIGGLYQPGVRRNRLNLVLPDITLFFDDSIGLTTKTKSVFGQLLLTPVDKFELSAGVRYTKIRKYHTKGIAYANFAPNPLGVDSMNNVSKANRDNSEDDTSPEVTLSYYPDDNITVFASYKQGYKGPGTNTNLVVASYNDTNVEPFPGEKVKGFEGGVKARLLDRRLNLTVTGYRYNYKDLQVAITDVQNSRVQIRPGASGRVQGFEIGATYSPESVPGLTMNAFLNYNDAHYTTFATAPCWGNQPAPACIDNVQDLTGKSLTIAPKLVGNAGFSYFTDVSDDYNVRLDVMAKFATKYNFTAEKHPGAISGKYILLNAQVALAKLDGSWELSLACTNCTNKLYAAHASDGGGPPDGLPSALTTNINAPQKLVLRLTVFPTLF